MTSRLALLALLLLPLSLAGGCASTDLTEGNDVFQRGVSEAEGGDVGQAIRTLSGGVRDHPQHVRMRFTLARLQFETGEAAHRQERAALREAARFAEAGQREQAQTSRKAAAEHRGRATPHYQAARENLRVVVSDAEDDHQAGWAHLLLMRTAVFFEDWDAGAEHLEKAIELGQVTGQRAAQWRTFQSSMRERAKPIDH